MYVSNSLQQLGLRTLGRIPGNPAAATPPNGCSRGRFTAGLSTSQHLNHYCAMRVGLAAALGLVSAAISGPACAQTGVVLGRVIARGTDLPLGYSVVKTASSGERFTSDAGRFTIRAPAGPLSITVKHIGYAPFDTTISVRGGDTVRVALALSLIAIQLPAVQSLSQFCAHPGTADARLSLQLAALFEQMIQNAERNRLLTRSYPFEMEIERKITRPEVSLLARFVAFDTVIQSSERKWRYEPGHMLGTRVYGPGVFEGKWTTITVPELADFADAAFLNNHCFDRSEEHTSELQ